MIRASFLLLLLTAATISSCGQSGTQAVHEQSVVDDAYKVCKAMTNTGLVSECTVHGFGRTVDVRIDTSGAEARKICAESSSMISKMTPRFAGQWQLQIFSPFSGEHPIAVCPLV